MKSQRKFVLVSVIGIVLVVGVMGFAAYRIIAPNWFYSRASEPTEAGSRGVIDARSNALTSIPTDHIDLASIERLYVFGGWDLELSQGNTPSLQVEATERVADRITVTEELGTLRLEVRRNTTYVNVKLRAVLTVPRIESIEIDGAANLVASGFNQDSLDLELAGAANVDVDDSNFTNVFVDVDGAANVDFGGSTIVNAEVDLDGANNVEFPLLEGSLTGSLDGLGKVVYRGAASETVDIDGLGLVQRK
jgi:hypothetical protein